MQGKELKQQKAVLISIQPRWCELIASGKKTVEVRKTAPKLEPPFKVYIYCTKGHFHRQYSDSAKAWRENVLGKVIGEFTCNSIECFTTDYRQNEEQTERISRQSCVDMVSLMEYEENSPCLYGWHISDLVLYGEPKPLSNYLRCPYPWDCGACDLFDGFDMSCNRKIRPPQSWCYVEG